MAAPIRLAIKHYSCCLAVINYGKLQWWFKSAFFSIPSKLLRNTSKILPFGVLAKVNAVDRLCFLPLAGYVDYVFLILHYQWQLAILPPHPLVTYVLLLAFV